MHLLKTFSAILELPQNNGRITPFEGMRGYAVLLVFLVHHHTLFGDLLPARSLSYEISQFSHDIGHTGVDLFFVLSGYLIYGHLISKAPPFFAYLWKRFRRIYPTFLFTLSCYVLASILVPSLSRLPREPLQVLAYLGANLLLLPGIFPIEPLITVTWSLSYEWLFYLAAPVLIGAVRLRRFRSPQRVCLLVGLLIGICLLTHFGLLLHVRLGLFVAGMILYEAVTGLKITGSLSTRGEYAAVLLYAAVLVLLVCFDWSGTGVAFRPHTSNRAQPEWTAFLSVGLFGVTLYAMAFHGMLQALFTQTAFRWLGNMSYSYFLCHGMILYATAWPVHRLLAPGSCSIPVFTALLAMNLLLTGLGSLAVFRWIEKPFSIQQPRVHRAAASVAVAAGRYPVPTTVGDTEQRS